MKKIAPVAYPVQLFVAFAIVAFGFVASTVFTNARSLQIETETDALVENALPSIERLSAAADALRDIEAASDDYPELPVDRLPAARAQITQRMADTETELSAYRKLPMSDGELEIYESGVPAEVLGVKTAVDRLLRQVDDHELDLAGRTADRDVRGATNRTATRLRALVRFNAAHAYDRARYIDTILHTNSRTALILDCGSVLLGILAALWVLRLHRAHMALLHSHGAVVQERANELEQFSRRVAHDLVSPLSALTYCLSAFKSVSETDPALRESMVRARSCVTRAQRMMDGIFEFAQSGGQPDSRAHADISEALEQASAEILLVDAPQRPEIIVVPFDVSQVACSRGVLASIVTNLMRNAAKFMSDSPLKQITLRARNDGDKILVEVEDTGPGVPAGLDDAIFEPYVRAEGATQPGLGLGLATVKRLCEAHHGEVGVRSQVGHGSVFWFALPKATSAAQSEPRLRTRAKTG